MAISHHNELSQSFKKHGDFAIPLPATTSKGLNPRCAYIWSALHRSSLTLSVLSARATTGKYLIQSTFAVLGRSRTKTRVPSILSISAYACYHSAQHSRDRALPGLRSIAVVVFVPEKFKKQRKGLKPVVAMVSPLIYAIPRGLRVLQLLLEQLQKSIYSPSHGRGHSSI